MTAACCLYLWTHWILPLGWWPRIWAGRLVAVASQILLALRYCCGMNLVALGGFSFAPDGLIRP